MSYIHDIIKIKYVREGWLPNWPYHLISDQEMCDAFLKQDIRVIPHEVFIVDSYDKLSTYLTNMMGYSGYMMSNYIVPYLKTCSDYDFKWDEEYAHDISALVVGLHNLCSTFSKEVETNPEASLPDWVYSYMIGRVFGPRFKDDDLTNVRELHDLFVLLDLVEASSSVVDNLEDEFTPIAGYACYQVSKRWIAKLPNDQKRPYGMFGEPHVIKSLRLQQDDLIS